MQLPLHITELVALSIDFEVLAPVIFIILYFISQFLGGGDKEKKAKKKQEKREAAERGKQSPMDSAEAEADEEARARRIREEIQRKIAERRAAENAGGGQQQAPVSTRRYDPNLPEHAQRRDFSGSPDIAREVPERLPPRRVEPTQTPTPAPRRIADQEPRVRASSFENAMAEQRRNLERASQAREEAFRQARSIERGVAATNLRLVEAHEARSAERRAALLTPAALRREILDELRDPETARKAIVLREVLGPPLGARNSIDPADRHF
ncbi:MAG: hypothetical protein JJT96_13460 [Opitutales bacterium]|nr:hypothetical protein [Opitutales bacterium]